MQLVRQFKDKFLTIAYFWFFIYVVRSINPFENLMTLIILFLKKEKCLFKKCVQRTKSSLS